ncbi:MAG TPA: hypothetical protein VMY88_07645 [Acidimicrobiales bacterium]|nr:hypothetical protein [Acidimicrobiales bacterium]
MTFLVACSDDKEAATPLDVVVTESGDRVNLEAPPSVKGGVVELSLTNSGQGPHSLQFIKDTSGNHTIDDVVAFLGASEQGGPIPDWLGEGGGIGTVAPGQTGRASFRLSEGKHFVWDDETDENDKNNGTRGGITELNVTSGSGGELPEAKGSVSAKEYEFTVNDLKPGATTIQFENTGKEFHHFIAAPLLPGKTIADAKTFFESQGQGGGPPPIDFESGVGTAVLAPGNALVADLQLEAGNYAMVCFINNRTGGPPHFTMGMLQEVKVA